MRITALPLVALVLGAGAVPLSEENSDSKLEKRCEWNDGHGPIDCSFFSIVFGSNGKNRNDFVVKGNNFEKADYMPCPIFQTGRYANYYSSLPYVLQMAPGNTCDAIAGAGAWWDGLHIKYANTFLNTPDDTRCGPVDNGWGRRCIIAQRP